MTLQVGDICVANSAATFGVAGSNQARVNVYRGGSLVETWESGWTGSITSNVSSYRNAFDQQGSFYCCDGFSASDGSRVWKFDIDGNFIGPPMIDTAPDSPWGNDIGEACAGECPPGSGFFAAGPVYHIIGMFNDVNNNMYTLRQNASIDDSGTTIHVLARYDVDGNPLQKYEVCFDWARQFGTSLPSERLVRDIQCAGMTCDGSKLIIASSYPFSSELGPFTITTYDLLGSSSVSQVFYQEDGLNIHSMQVDPRNGNVVCAIGLRGNSTVSDIRIFSPTGEILDSFPIGIEGDMEAIDFDVDFRYIIVGMQTGSGPGTFQGQSSFYRVNLVSHALEGPIFTSDQSFGNSFAVFRGTKPCDQLGAVSVFGTVIGAT